MIKKRNVPADTVRRMSLYLRKLKSLKEKGALTVSSREITLYLNIPAEQFRKDLSYFGGFGKRGVGYDLDRLINAVEEILGVNRVWKVILVGTGKLGSALLGYPGFARFNIRIADAFDTDPAKIGKSIGGMKVRSFREIADRVAVLGARIAVLCVPAEVAQDVADELVRCGVKGILNFAPVNLLMPAGIAVTGVDMACELETIIYRLKEERS